MLLLQVRAVKASCSAIAGELPGRSLLAAKVKVFLFNCLAFIFVLKMPLSMDSVVAPRQVIQFYAL